MPERFQAFRIHRAQQGVIAGFEALTVDQLTDGDVVVRVEYSSINYKDALAATGAGKILRKFPLVGGVDFSGQVVSSSDARFRPGQAVLVTGCGLSETHDGGYAEYARVPAEWVIPAPPGFDTFQVMQLGTAGFTAALAIQRMEDNGQAPDQGEIAVTGATGGVGSVAIDMLASRGYQAVVFTGKADSEAYLKKIGAARIVLRQELTLGTQPLEPARWAGAIDNVGGDLLSWLIRGTRQQGNVASIGLAAGSELHTSVMPFILRGVNLLGINSSATPRSLRERIWQRIATDLRPRHLDVIADKVIDFKQLPAAFGAYLKGGVVGRTVVRIGA